MAYVPVPPIMTAPGAPIIESLAFRTRDNPLAVAAGDVSVPLSNRVNLALALRTSQLDQTRVLQANGAQGWQWGAPPRGIREQVRLTSGTWVVPAGVTRIEVELWGGGCNANDTTQGGSGAYVRAILPTTPGETLDFTVGGIGFPGGATQISNAGDTVQAIANGGNSTTSTPSVPATGSAIGAIGVPLIRSGRRSFPAANRCFLPIRGAPFALGSFGGGQSRHPQGSGLRNAYPGYLIWKYYGT